MSEKTVLKCLKKAAATSYLGNPGHIMINNTMVDLIMLVMKDNNQHLPIREAII